jgi:tartrate/fumarate subfamily iron-sulfur-dependent hydro-lyase beta chain
MAIPLQSPYTEELVRSLRVGDRVHVSGTVFTARDRMHRYLAEGGETPISLKSAAIFHCGPLMVRRDGAWHITAAGPTMSTRQELYMATIIRKVGIRVVIGSGGMGAATTAACQKEGCVYLHAVGGTATLHAARVHSVPNVHLLKEMGPTEALWELNVRSIPAVVTIDTHGGNLHCQIKEQSRKALERLIGKFPRGGAT